MSDDDQDDLEECWKELERQPLVEVIRTRGSDIDNMMEVAAEKAIFDLKKYILERHEHKDVADVGVLSDIVTTGVKMFLKKWQGELRTQNLAGLIEIVLEGQSLSPDELQGFLRALPMSLLTRIAESVVGSATGTHALMSLEYIRRTAGNPYTIGAIGHRIWAEFAHPRTREVVRFFLDEEFKFPDTPPTAPPV